MKNRPSYLLSLISLVLGVLLMMYLRQVYFVGIMICFIILMFQMPSTKVDPTGETNDANIAMLKFVGLNILLYLIGGYAAILFF